MRGHAELTDDLALLARVADELEISHAIPSDAETLLGRQQHLRTAAESWRELADSAEQASNEIAAELGGIDAAWEGAAAEAFLAHARELGLANNGLTDTMRALAAALEHTTEALRVQLRDLRELVADAADDVRDAAPERARELLLELADPVREILESAGDSYHDFARTCDELASQPNPAASEPTASEPAAPEPAAGTPATGTPATGTPATGTAAPGTAGEAPRAEGSAAPATPPAAPVSGEPQAMASGGTASAGEPGEDEASGSAVGGVAGATVGAAGAGVASGMMPMGGMLGRQGGRAQERTNDSRIKNDPEELFGSPPDAAPAVFGEPEEDADTERKLEVPSLLQPGEPKPSIEETLSPDS